MLDRTTNCNPDAGTGTDARDAHGGPDPPRYGDGDEAQQAVGLRPHGRARRGAPVSAVAAACADLARDLHALLVDLDASRGRTSQPATRLDAIRARLAELLDHTWPEGPPIAALRRQVSELARLVEEHAPSSPFGRAEWKAFRARALPAYEALAAALRDCEIHVPSLRPTNWARNAYHAASAAALILLVEVWLTPAQVVVVACLGAALAATMEITRRLDPRVNRVLMRLFGPVAHPHEAYRVNSATWYTLAVLLLALFSNYTAGAVGLAVLGLGDPAAAVIGRRYGRVHLVAGRTLEGTMAFIAFGFLAGAAVLRLWHPDVGLHVALAAATCGAAAELLARRVDDNLAVPLAAAAGAWLAM